MFEDDENISCVYGFFEPRVAFRNGQFALITGEWLNIGYVCELGYADLDGQMVFHSVDMSPEAVANVQQVATAWAWCETHAKADWHVRFKSEPLNGGVEVFLKFDGPEDEAAFLAANPGVSA